MRHIHTHACRHVHAVYSTVYRQSRFPCTDCHSYIRVADIALTIVSHLQSVPDTWLVPCAQRTSTQGVGTVTTLVHNARTRTGACTACVERDSIHCSQLLALQHSCTACAYALHLRQALLMCTLMHVMIGSCSTSCFC